MADLRTAARPEIFDIQPYVPGKPIEEVQRELGLTDVIKLASNENPLGPSPKALAALREGMTGLALYPDGNAFALKARLAKELGVDESQLAVGNGSDELIKCLAETFLQPDDEVITADPTFAEYEFAAHLMGAGIRRIPVANEVHDLPAMAAAIGPRTKLIFVCNPNNPTGTMVQRGDLDRFMALVPPEVIVVFDQAYQEYAGPAFADGLEYVRRGRRAVVLRTFSKIYGLAGLRVGYAIGSTELVGLLGRVREPFNVNLAAQLAATAALDDVAFLAKSRALNTAGMAQIDAGLRALGAVPVPSAANFIFARVPADSRSLFQAMLRRGVIIRTGDIFGRPDHIRVTIGTEQQNARFLVALEAALDELRAASDVKGVVQK